MSWGGGGGHPFERDDDELEADAAGLFEASPSISPIPHHPPRANPADAGGGYDMLGTEDAPDEAAPPRPPVIPPAVAAKPRGPKTQRTIDEEDQPENDDHVAEIWTRRAEWGGTIVRLAMVAAAVIAIVYFTLSPDRIALSVLLLGLGIVALAVCAYPIAVTIERPVRAIPEQAVKDYFDALSHHFPHYRRMYLILSAKGKRCRWYSSEQDFIMYWKQRLVSLRPAGLRAAKPLDFAIEDFLADKSAGKNAMDVDFRVVVRVRGVEKPIASFQRTVGVVKGPDKMWYLGDGTLADDAGAKPARKRRPVE